MKTLAATTALLVVLASTSAFAAPQKWQGSGAEYSPEGQELTAYTVETVNTELAPQKIQSETTVTLANGTRKVVSQTLTIRGESWKDDSNLGTGGGACYGGDVCENYLAGADGMSYATTIVHDSKTEQRQITVVMKNGKALKMLKQKLVLVP